MGDSNEAIYGIDNDSVDLGLSRCAPKPDSGRGIESGERSRAEGKAYPVVDEATGHLKVSFFGPFYGSYVIFELDESYEYAFVSGPDTDYAWLLSRTPTISDEVKQRFVESLSGAGFDASELIWVEQE